MRLLLTALLLCISTAPLPAATKIFPYPYTSHELPNGLRLITIPTEFPNIVSVFIVAGAGSRNELRDAGAASNAFTTDDFTACHATFFREDLPRILSMEADRFQHVACEPGAFKTETLAALGEYNKSGAQSAGFLNLDSPRGTGSGSICAVAGAL